MKNDGKVSDGDTRSRVKIGHVWVDRLDMASALDAVSERIESRLGGYVVTPNVDHVVLADEDLRFRAAYDDAALSLADGMPVVWASHLLGHPVPEKISGSDFTLPLLERAGQRGWRTFFLGAGPGVAESAAQIARMRWNTNVVGTASPMLDASVTVDPALVEQIRGAAPDLVLVAFGAPKQEIFCHKLAEALKPAVLLGIGATLDFIAGTVQRAPPWMSNHGLEWMYRLAKEPRRLWKRYLLRDPKFVLAVARTLRTQREDRIRRG